MLLEISIQLRTLVKPRVFLHSRTHAGNTSYYVHITGSDGFDRVVPICMGSPSEFIQNRLIEVFRRVYLWHGFPANFRKRIEVISTFGEFDKHVKLADAALNNFFVGEL